jgi:type I restriction enzyme M protein
MNNTLSNKIPKITLYELTTVIKNGLSSYYINAGAVTTYLVNVKDIQNGRINADKVEVVKVKETEALDKNRLEKGDLVVTAKGQNFKAAVAMKDVEGYVISANLIALKLNGHVDPELVAAYLNNPLGQREINARAAGGIVKGLNCKGLLEIPIPVPPIEKQKVLVEYLRLINEYSEVLEKEQMLVDRIRNSIISDIMG